MNSSQAIYQALKNAGINFVVSLPCVNLGESWKRFIATGILSYVPVTREEEGFGICVEPDILEE